MSRVLPLLAVGSLLGFVGCDGQPGGNYRSAAEIKNSAPNRPANADEHDHAHEGHDHGDHDHHHEPPHGGTLTMLGDHGGQVELLLDKETGKLTLYGLDGEGEKETALEQGEVELKLTSIGGKDADATVSLKGEKAEGNKAAVFTATVESLKGQTEFAGVYTSLTISGQKPYEKVKVTYNPGHDDHGHAGEGHDHKEADHDHKEAGHKEAGHKEEGHKDEKPSGEKPASEKPAEEKPAEKK